MIRISEESVLKDFLYNCSLLKNIDLCKLSHLLCIFVKGKVISIIEYQFTHITLDKLYFLLSVTLFPVLYFYLFHTSTGLWCFSARFSAGNRFLTLMNELCQSLYTLMPWHPLE